VSSRRAFTRCCARRSRRPGEIVLRLGVLARDRPGHSEAIGGDGHYGRTSRHRPDLVVRRRCDARSRHEADRRGRAPLLRFVPLQHSPAAARRVRWMPTIRTIPLRRFRRRPARFVAQYRLSRRRPPVRFCARGSASWRRLMWRTCGSCSFVGRAPHEWDRLTFPKISTFDTSLITVAGVDPLVDALAVTRSTSVGAGSRLPVRGRVIRRGRFSHAVFRTRYSHPRAPQPGRAVWVLPSYRPAALLGLHPLQVCSRSAGGRAG